MQQIYQFFRLIRFANILVIVLTMSLFYGLLSNYSTHRQYILSGYHSAREMLDPTLLETLGFTDFNFILLLLSVVLIASAGNIINDYFDQKADRINKPGRLIIDKYIKRRWAIILNWTLNGIGFMLALYLSLVLHNWWIVIVSFLSINLLYFYSAIFKRKFLTGNIIVAFLTAIVPFYVFIYAAFSTFKNTPFIRTDEIFIADNLYAVVGYCGFAFFLNLIREIIKDIADVKGDLLLKSRTIPIKFGFKRTKYFLTFLYLIVLLPLIYFIVDHSMIILSSTSGVAEMTFIYLIGTVVLFVVASFFILISYNKRTHYSLSSNLLKFAMLFGVLSALFYS